jgi:ABC-type Fe3+-hydroxamate transport system substrate-binding protein
MPVELADVRGVTLHLPEPPRRVVSLVPSITETLFHLGVGDTVVGITDWCIFPEDLSLPRVGGTKNPNVDAIRALSPDLVHMNLEENQRKHAEVIGEFAPVFVTEPKSPGDVIDLLQGLGEIHGCQQEATTLAGTLEVELCRRPVASFSFVCPIWRNPWMWCGGDTYVSALVEAVGGRNLLRDRDRYPSLEIADLASLHPDVVFLPDEPYEFTESEAHELGGMLGARVIGPFPGHLFTWHGSRTIEGLRTLRDWFS